MAGRCPWGQCGLVQRRAEGQWNVDGVGEWTGKEGVAAGGTRVPRPRASGPASLLGFCHTRALIRQQEPDPSRFNQPAGFQSRRAVVPEVKEHQGCTLSPGPTGILFELALTGTFFTLEVSVSDGPGISPDPFHGIH